jgi:hypothetical protein
VDRILNTGKCIFEDSHFVARISKRVLPEHDKYCCNFTNYKFVIIPVAIIMIIIVIIILGLCYYSSTFHLTEWLVYVFEPSTFRIQIYQQYRCAKLRDFCGLSLTVSLNYCDRSPEIWAVTTQRTAGYRCHIRGNGYRQLSNYTQRLGGTLYPRQPLCTVIG